MLLFGNWFTGSDHETCVISCTHLSVLLLQLYLYPCWLINSHCKCKSVLALSKGLPIVSSIMCRSVSILVLGHHKCTSDITVDQPASCMYLTSGWWNMIECSVCVWEYILERRNQYLASNSLYLCLGGFSNTDYVMNISSMVITTLLKQQQPKNHYFSIWHFHTYQNVHSNGLSSYLHITYMYLILWVW